MLHFFRENAKGWIGYIIIAGIIMVFIPWGISSYTQDADEASVAVVNGNDITLQQYQRAYQQQRNRIQSMLGKNANPELLASILKPQNILDSLVERELLLDTADNNGFRIADKQLAAQIQSIEAFQQDGRFSKESYERVLRNQGYSSTYFESSVLSDALISQVNTGMRSTVLVTNNAVDRYIRIKNQEREVSTLLIPAEKFEKDIVVEDEKIKQYYKENKQQFFTPEQASVFYIEYKASDLKSSIEYTEEELKKVYESQKSSLGVGEERKASHILLQINDKSDSKEASNVLAKANALLDRINGGESFIKIAKENSEDSGSSAQGGDLGFFGKGIMDPAFESAAFAMQEGDVSGPVKTSFGYHIIKLEKIRAGSQKPFEQVRDQIISTFTQQKAENQFFDQSELLATIAYEQPDSLDAVAELLKLEIKSTEFFSKSGGKGIASNKKVVQLAFGDEVLNKKFNSEPIEIGTNHIVIIHLKAHRPRQQKELDTVKNDIQFVLKKNMASEKAAAVGQKIVAALKAGADKAAEVELTELTKSLALTWEEKKFINRREQEIDRSIVEAVFKTPFKKAGAEENAIIVDGKKIRSGAYVVYQLFDIKTPDVSKVEKAERERLSNELTTLYSNEEFNNYLASLKQNASVKIFSENLTE